MVFSALQAFPLMTAVWYGEWGMAKLFGVFLLAYFGAGALLRKRTIPLRIFVKSEGYSIPYVDVALIWVLFGLLSSIHFFVTGLWGPSLGLNATSAAEVNVFASFTNALFEGVSGLTSTGLTVIDPEKVPRSILAWRSILQWWGGIGVILTSAFFLGHIFNYKILEVEVNEKIHGKESHAVLLRILSIYLVLTVISIVGFFALGMPLWEALNHGLTSSSTGGFSVNSNSFTSYSSEIKVLASGVSLLSSLNLLYVANVILKGDLTLFHKNSSLWVMMLAVCTGLAAALYSADGEKDIWFNWFTVISTCGLSSGTASSWNPALVWIMIIGMTVGGCVGSTAGGLKIDRIRHYFFNIKLYLSEVWAERPHLISTLGKRKTLGEMEFRETLRFSSLINILWMGGLMLGTWILLWLSDGSISIEEAIFDVSSALGNVGHSMGTITSETHWFAKLTMSGLMLFGRLEMISFLVLFSFGLKMILNGKASR